MVGGSRNALQWFGEKLIDYSQQSSENHMLNAFLHVELHQLLSPLQLATLVNVSTMCHADENYVVRGAKPFASPSA